MTESAETRGQAARGPRAALAALREAPRWQRAALAAILLAGLAARLVLVLVARPVLASDARDYDVLARNLLDGRGYVQVYEGETESFNGFTFRAFRSPGYPLLLAAWYAVFGRQPAVALLANVLADLVTQGCFVLIAVHLLGSGPALLVAGLLAGHVLWTPLLMTESVYTALFAGLAAWLVFGGFERSAGGALGGGVLLAAALLTRPITVCLLPVLAWRVARSPRPQRAAGLLALALLPAGLGLAAWGARNYRLFGQLVLLTTNAGHHNAWDYGIHRDRLFIELRRRGLNEAEINDVFIALERQILLENPGPVLWLWTLRAVELFALHPPYELRHTLWQHTFGGGRWSAAVGRAYRAAYAQYYVTYALAAAGAVVLALGRRRLGGLWLLGAAYVVIHGVVSRGDMRLVAPLYPLMCLLAAGGVQSVWRRCRRRRPAPD